MPIVFAPKNLSDLDLQEIELIFEHMDPSCFTIDFSHDEKFGLNPNHWGKILQILPKKIFTLIFSSKQLCHCSQEDLFIIFNEKPQNIKCLDFGYCALSRMSEEKRNLMLETCTQNLHSLSLSGNKLYQLKRFDQLAHSLNKQLLSLNLSNNLLVNMQLIEFLNNIKSPLHHLDLQGNYIADTEEELVRLIQALPDTIYSIRLEILWTISLKVPFGFLKNIVYLNLDGSALFHKEMQILADELSALPPSLKHLQLTNNALHVKSPQELAVLFAHIPLSVRTILVDKSKLSLAQVNVLSKDPRVQFEAKPKNASFTFFSSDAASGVENRLITAKL